MSRAGRWPLIISAVLFTIFVVSGLTGTSILKIAGKAIPYVIAMFCVVLLLAFVPELSLWAIS